MSEATAFFLGVLLGIGCGVFLHKCMMDIANDFFDLRGKERCRVGERPIKMSHTTARDAADKICEGMDGLAEAIKRGPDPDMVAAVESDIRAGRYKSVAERILEAQALSAVSKWLNSDGEQPCDHAIANYLSYLVAQWLRCRTKGLEPHAYRTMAILSSAIRDISERCHQQCSSALMDAVKEPS